MLLLQREGFKDTRDHRVLGEQDPNRKYNSRLEDIFSKGNKNRKLDSYVASVLFGISDKGMLAGRARTVRRCDLNA